MNKQQLARKRMEVLQKVRVSNRKVNVLRVSPNNTYDHEKTKFDVFFHCRQQGWDVISEAIFENGKRADILILDTNTVVEVIKSEKEAACLSKTANYFVETFIIVDANYEFKGEDVF